jgi:hypothetical protein
LPLNITDMKKLLVIIAAVGITAAGCTKSPFESDANTDRATRTAKKQKYDQFNCATEGSKCTMIECKATVTSNGTCKKAKPCEPVEGTCDMPKAVLLANASTLATDYANTMLNTDYIDQADWQSTYDLAYELIIAQANAMP